MPIRRGIGRDVSQRRPWAEGGVAELRGAFGETGVVRGEVERRFRRKRPTLSALP